MYQARKPRHCREPLECIREQHKDARGFAEIAEDIRCADVATANLPDIHSPAFRDQKSRRDRPQQVSD